jgi:hypothetical protein
MYVICLRKTRIESQASAIVLVFYVLHYHIFCVYTIITIHVYHNKCTYITRVISQTHAMVVFAWRHVVGGMFTPTELDLDRLKYTRVCIYACINLCIYVCIYAMVCVCGLWRHVHADGAES